jgi:hypothetical protein
MRHWFEHNGERCDQGIVGETCDQRLGSPTAKRRIHGQSLTTLAPSPQAGKVCLHRCFIQKNNAIRHPGDGG